MALALLALSNTVWKDSPEATSTLKNSAIAVQPPSPSDTTLTYVILPYDTANY